MPDFRRLIFDHIRAVAPAGVFNIRGNVDALDAVLDKLGIPAADSFSTLTVSTVLELLEHEAIVREMYYDSQHIATWGVGITSSANIDVTKFKDYPTSIQYCLEVYIDVLRTIYLPAVLKAFDGHVLKENELAAALSFHYNTGAIARASWVQLWTAGKRDDAYESIMQWVNPKEVISRRKAERDLFFNGHWTSDGKVVVYEVNKPSYTPNWKSAKLVDVRADLEKLLKEPGQ